MEPFRASLVAEHFPYSLIGGIDCKEKLEPYHSQGFNLQTFVSI